jgi:hypothetical protein
LYGLNGHDLHDIGIAHGDIEYVAAKAESTADLAVFAWYSDRSRKACMTAVNLTAVA